jgi:hypothetical protein
MDTEKKLTHLFRHLELLTVILKEQYACRSGNTYDIETSIKKTNEEITRLLAQ